MLVLLFVTCKITLIKKCLRFFHPVIITPLRLLQTLTNYYEEVSFMTHASQYKVKYQKAMHDLLLNFVFKKYIWLRKKIYACM